MTRAQDLLTVLGERIGGGSHVRSVFGEPVIAGDRTIIPVARIRFGMGAGAGGIDKQNSENTHVERSGGGGGGGGIATPAGVVEITATGTRFIQYPDPKRIAAAVAIGFLIGLVIGRRRSRT